MECGFQKTIICLNFYLIKVKTLLTKLKIKNMNKIICILMFLPIFVKAQEDVNEALKFQNMLRTYQYSENLSVDPSLSLYANDFANELLLSDSLYSQDDEIAEAIFSIQNVGLPYDYNPYLDASIAWAIDTDDIATLENIMDPDYNLVGFGLAKSKTKIIVVAKFR